MYSIGGGAYMINILVCDDDSNWLRISEDILIQLSKKYNILLEISTYNSMREIPKEDIEKKRIDIAYLDIELSNGENGIELAKLIQKYNKWAIIFFLTSHREFTKEAFFDIQAFGYLGKPIKHNIFENYFQKAVLQVASIKNRSITSVLEFYSDKLPVKVKQREIIYIEKIERKITIKTLKRSYQVNESIKQLESRLDSSFLKVNQSVIVNMREVSFLSNSICCLKTGQEFTIGRTYKNNVKDTYEKFSVL